MSREVPNDRSTRSTRSPPSGPRPRWRRIEGPRRIPTSFKVIAALLLIMFLAPACQSMTGRSAGRYIDDKTITAKVKSKIVGEKASNLTRVGVNTVNGVVYLDGVVD